MFIALGMIALVALGVVIGRYPDFLWRHSRFLLSGPRLIWFWLVERIKRNPAIFGAFFSGFFVGLLVSGGLSRLFWYLSLVGLLVFCVLVFFPTIGGKIAQAVYNFSRFCVVRIKKFFA